MADSELPDTGKATESRVSTDRMPGYQLLAKLGKRVLRPGGAALTQKLLHDLAIGSDDHVVELAPGLGATTERILAAHPASYVGVDRDAALVGTTSRLLEGPDRQIVQGSVSHTGLDDASCDVALGEAYLTMNPTSQKRRILAELARIVRPGGRLGLHEVAFRDDHAFEVEEIHTKKELKLHFRIDFSALPLQEWKELLAEAGFTPEAEAHTGDLRLLDPGRIIADEGYLGAARFGFNLMLNPDVIPRLVTMRNAMHEQAERLEAFALVATRDG